MAKSKIQQAAYDKIGDLVEHFASQIEVLKKKQKEAETRIMYINPLFDALGWDIDNTKLRLPVSYKDVIHEDELKIGGKTKAPDYCFTNYGKRTFFLEAKKPSVLIKTDTDPSYQLRRYGWSAKLPISILTDFEEFAMYDCTKQPKENDTTTVGRLKYITYDQYLKEFDWIWDLFSKEQVVKGSLGQFAKADKKGTQSVDYAFLQSLDEWRNLLATNIAIRNKQLNEDEINYIVQMNINRIVFLRNCEDRGAEAYGKLKDCLVNANDEGAYFNNMYRLFGEADRKYNSGLFDFSKDTLSKSVVIDNKIISTIVSELYYPKSPYEFSVIGAEILGTAYERFLGKVIRLTAGHQAKVEEKPEVRKAGGVFYTPQYIVEYIVKNTVGKLIEAKTPEEIEKIKICDPACGSGSFLLGAYQFLLNYHTDWYTNNYKKSRNVKDSPLTPEGNLTTQIKKEILLNNIYGVDLDAQAVEVTKLSLLMKCMEGETAASMQTTLTFERVLPTLDNNIKSGNSLIDFDFYEGQLDFGEDKKIKPFNWKQAFPKVYKQGGFDVVIGNPPYVQMSMFEWFDSEHKKYLLSKYCSSMGRMNTFGFFFEKGIDLLTKKGKLGYIIPNTILTQEYYQELRQLILKQTQIDEIVSYDHLPFVDAVVEVATLILAKETSSKPVKLVLCKKDLTYEVKETAQIKFDLAYKNQFNVTQNDVDAELKQTILSKSNQTFSDIAEINQAIALKSDRAAYLFDKKVDKNYKPVLDGREIGRYEITWAKKYLKYDVGAIHSCKREDIFLSKEKIFFRRVSSTLIGAIDTEQFYALNTLICVNLKPTTEYNLRFILGIFNSSLMNYYYTTFLKSTKKVFSEIQARQIGQLPIPNINLKVKIDLQRHDEIVKQVNLIHELKKDNSTNKVSERISYAEQRINEIVYELYELSQEEIQIIENQ